MTELGNRLGNTVDVEGIGEVDLSLASPRCKQCQGTGCIGTITRGEDTVKLVCPCVLNAHARRRASHQEAARRIVSLKGVAKLTQLPLMSVHAGEVQKACTQGAALEASATKGGGK